MVLHAVQPPSISRSPPCQHVTHLDMCLAWVRAVGSGAGDLNASSLPHSASDTDSVGDLSVFAVSLCDGVGGGLLACKARTANLQAHIVESGTRLRQLVCSHFLRVTAESDILTLDIDSRVSRVDSAQWELLILIGGPPMPAIFTPWVRNIWF